MTGCLLRGLHSTDNHNFCAKQNFTARHNAAHSACLMSVHLSLTNMLLHAKFRPNRCNVSPLRGEKPQNRPLRKLNTGRLALRAMLPVMSSDLPC